MHHPPSQSHPTLLPPALFSLARLASPATLPLQAEFPVLPDSTPFGSCVKTVPTFNQDRRYFTPAFILGFDKNTYASRLGLYLLQHSQKVAEWQLQKQKIMLPKPSRNNSYCCICRTHFQDYLTHTALPSHLQLLRNNDYTRMIAQLSQGFHKQPSEAQETGESVTCSRKRGRPCKTKPIAKRVCIKNVRESCGEESPKTLEPALSVQA